MNVLFTYGTNAWERLLVQVKMFGVCPVNRDTRAYYLLFDLFTKHNKEVRSDWGNLEHCGRTVNDVIKHFEELV